jgi:hypothetical protein
MAEHKASRIGILVLGMHRAGTSLLGQSLGAVGCSPPRTLIGPSANNEGGYWESRLIQSFNDELLTASGSSWDDWQPVPDPAAQQEAAEARLAGARSLIEREFGDAALFVLKEPRICRLVPFWLKAMEGIDIRVILALRNPLEVAASLARRNGIEPGLAHLMWLSHMLEAEAATRGLPRVVAGYDALLADWQGAMRQIGTALKIDWPGPAGDSGQGPLASEALRHHRHSQADLAKAAGLPGGLVRAQAILQQWSQTGEDPADHAEIDTILAQLRHDAGIFGPLVSLARKRAVALQSAERRIAGLEAARAQALAEQDRRAAPPPPVTGATGATGPLPDGVEQDLRKLLDHAMAELRNHAEAEARRTREHEREKALSSEELARLTLLLQQTEADLAETRAGLERLQQSQADARLTEERLRHDLARTAVTARILMGLLKEEEDRIGWIPRGLRRKRQVAALLRTGLFDPAFYLQANPDVAEAGDDPAEHYLLHGLVENRLSIPDPGRIIDPVPAENGPDPTGDGGR